jgi:hypothetical protein
MSLIRAINEEIKRCREVKELYDMLPGGQGAFGSTQIQMAIGAAQKAVENSDTVGMVRGLQALKNIN